jgi:hypothetical protein
MTIPYRPLGLIATLVEALGLQVTYAYDDLVFIEHNAFLLRMGDEGEDVYLYFNTASDPQERKNISRQLSAQAIHKGLVIHELGTYEMNPADSENLRIQFHDYEMS